MTDASQDPIAGLSHDHGHLSGLVITVGRIITRIEQGELSLDEGAAELDDASEALRDDLLVHFAREEEGFFPFIEASVAVLRPQLHALHEEHDAVCARVDELCAAVHRVQNDGAGCADVAAAFGRFEEIYAKHAQAELALLRDVDAKLDDASRERLRLLLAET